MRKSLTAAAVIAALGAVSAAQAADVKISGVIDNYIEAYSNGDGTQARLSSGGAGGSRLTLEGTEDLGDGLAAFFKLEMGMLTDYGASSPDNSTQSSYLFHHEATMGLKSNTLGSLSFGRQYTPTFIALASMDPAGLALGSAMGTFSQPIDRGVNGGNATDNGTRRDNSVVWKSPKMGNFLVHAMAALGEDARDDGSASSTRRNYYGASVRYVDGPVNVVVAGAALKSRFHLGTEGQQYGGWDFLSSIGATYDLGWIKPAIMVNFRKGDDFRSSNVYNAAGTRTKLGSDTILAAQAGFSAPVPGGKIAVTVGYAHNRTLDEADAWSAGMRYDYPLSKRTFLYCGAIGVWNEDNADYSLSGGGGSSAGPDTVVGKNASTFFAGVHHSF
ncbi:porin [Sutterella sp.]|uniref:porin n=1 Tax=Sutterella sp. TaxID=1981025 RepID=UPI0026DFBE5C|nr:porin [Sutterella sp.]MDO5532309.1 porin [Sutterella sp.]